MKVIVEPKLRKQLKNLIKPGSKENKNHEDQVQVYSYEGRSGVCAIDPPKTS